VESVKTLGVSSVFTSYFSLLLILYDDLNNDLDCSKECQVTDWKKHKVECLKKLRDVTASKIEDTDDLSKPVFNLTRRMCAKCEKLQLGQKLLVCAKCKYVGCKSYYYSSIYLRNK
jgi:uncharacterized UBP type Zn finger protein